MVGALNYLFSTVVIPALDTSYLSPPQYGGTTIEAVLGAWSIICALFLSILALLAMNYGRVTDVRRSLDEGASSSVLPIFNPALRWDSGP